MRAELRETVDVAVPAERLWQVVTDWPLQSEWIPFTRVRTPAGDGQGLGGRLEARTGFGPVGFLDTMVVTHWSVPAEGRRVCEVLHTGRLVRGDGGFEVEPIDATSSRFIWWESFELPLGRAGALGWRLLAPLSQAGIRRALDRLRTLALQRA
ncbi:MAG TPA: SRPBCC family protein [Nocardioidaceae bacterium]|nr:SRPBCC family protein [Nocardioidaceae bacterium]